MGLPNLDLVGACENIVKEAEDLAGQNYAFNLKKKTGALDFITSPENGSVDPSLISYDEGRKMATLKIYYDQRTKACEIITNCNSGVCDEGTMPVRKQAIIEIGSCVKTPPRWYSNDDLIGLCMDSQTFIRKRLGSDLTAAKEVMSTRTLAELLAAMGINLNSEGATIPAGSFKSVDLVDTTGSEPEPNAGNWAKVIMDYEENQLTGIPAVIGQGNIDLFRKLQGWACCNSATPYGSADIEADARFYTDQNANAVLGPNNFILAAFQAMHMLTFNENRNININSPTIQHIVFPDPMGYPFDWNLDIVWDECNKRWKIQASLIYGFFNVLRNDSFAARGESTSPDSSPDCSDELDGMTGVFGYTAA